MSRIVAIVGFGLLVGCVHTPPHPPVEGTWSREFTRRQELRRDGRYCAWEAESPAWSGTLLWPAEAPIGDPAELRARAACLRGARVARGSCEGSLGSGAARETE